MKKLILLTALLFPTFSLSQSNQSFGTFNKPVTCAPIEIILKGLSDPDIKEMPLWIGKDETEKSEYVIFVNSKTKAFTIVQMGQQVGCILGIGYKSYLVEEKKL
jgi:hypothetical protein